MRDIFQLAFEVIGKTPADYTEIPPSMPTDRLASIAYRPILSLDASRSGNLAARIAACAAATS